jgi:hypothetical protein
MATAGFGRFFAQSWPLAGGWSGFWVRNRLKYTPLPVLQDQPVHSLQRPRHHPPVTEGCMGFFNFDSR